MPIEYRSYAAGTTSVALPTGVVDGDMLIWIGGVNSEVQPAIPTGFTAIDDITGTGCRARTAYKIASSESGPYAASGNTSSQIVAFQKYGTSRGPWEVPTITKLHSGKTVTGTSLTTDAITSDHAYNTMLMAWINAGAQTIVGGVSQSTLIYERVDSGFSNTTYYDEVCLEGDKTKTLTYDTSDEIIGFAICLSVGGMWLTSFDLNRIKFTVNLNKVDSPLTNFPVRIDISDESGNADDDLTAFFDELAYTAPTGDTFTGGDITDTFFNTDYWYDDGFWCDWDGSAWTHGTYNNAICYPQCNPGLPYDFSWKDGYTADTLKVTLDNITGGSGNFTIRLNLATGSDPEATGVAMSDTDTYDLDISSWTEDQALDGIWIEDEAGGARPFDVTNIQFIRKQLDPNPDLWVEEENTNGSAALTTTELNFNASPSGADDVMSYWTKFKISGNFDIQIDFSPTTIDKPTVARHLGGIFTIANQPNLDDEYCSIGFFRDNVGGGSYNFAAWGSSTTDDPAAESKFNTKFRFVRSGSVISVYYHNGSSWEYESAGSKTMSETFTDDIYVNIKSECLDGENMDVDWDNFVITSGTVKWPDFTHPNRKKIAVANYQGIVQYYCEMEYFDAVNEKARVWARIPYIDSTKSADPVFYLYYDSSRDFSNTKYVGEIGDTALDQVWSNNYRVALHMAQDPTTPFQPRELHASTAVMDQGSPNIDCNYTFTAVDCTGLTKANGQLFVFIRCSNWSLVTSCKISLTSSAGLGTEEWYLDKTAIEALYPSGIQSSIEPLLFPLAGCTTTGGELDVTAIDHLSFSAVVTGTVWLFWRSASILPIDLPVKDSVEGNHAVGFGGMNASNMIDTGFGGKGYTLDGSGENISLDTWCNAMEAVNYGTVELVIQGNVAANGTLFSFSEPMESNSEGHILRKSDGDVEAAVRDEGTYDLQMDAEVDVSDVDWHVIQWVMGTSYNKLWIDGVKVTGDYTVGNSSSHGWLGDLNTTDGNVTSMRIGANRNNSSPAGITLFSGKIGEFHYSQTARADAWTKANYHNFIDNLLNYGGEPPPEGGGGGMFGQLRHGAVFGGLIVR